jgi:TldD protein
VKYAQESAQALDTCHTRGAEYAEVRFEDEAAQLVEIRNGEVDTLADTRESGYGIRALVAGAWGFASSSDRSKAGIDATAARAVKLAKAAAQVSRTFKVLRPERKHIDTFRTPFLRDPKTVGLDERIKMLLEIEGALHVSPKVRVGKAYIDTRSIDKYFFDSNGSQIDQYIMQTGSGIIALAVDDGEAQDRGYPGDHGLFQTGGWEIVEAAKLSDNAARIGEEAVALLSAPQCPQGEFDLILGGSQVSLQIHESLGHAAELDRVLGWEASFSGTSFLTIDQLNTLQYGSPHVTIQIDNTLAGGFATVGYDDEGTPSSVDDIVRKGLLVGFESSRDTAHLIGRESNACVRTGGWQYTPMIRMCNLNLLPGKHTFDELFDDVKHGIYMESNRSWSIDDRRLNFQFGCQIGWEIVNGKKTRMVKNPTYAGVTPNFWNSCDAIANADSWVAWGTPNCGKGEPLQTGRTTQAASPARFRKVAIGVGYDA